MKHRRASGTRGVRGLNYLGIDPGVSGGIAIVDEAGVVITVEKMPADAARLAMILGAVPTDTIACVEKVHSSPQMGVSSAFTFGNGYGRIEGVLAAYEIDTTFVTPQRWQTDMDCRTGGDKNVTKMRAQQMFPNVRITLWNADALLLAMYCRRLKGQ